MPSPRNLLVCSAMLLVASIATTSDPLLAQERTVSRVGAVAKPRTYAGSCPTEIQFIGTIHVTRHPVAVEYQWERSDGAKGPKERVEIRSSGQGVTTTWQLGGGKQHVRVWEKLHVLSPTGVYSPPAAANIVCK